MPRRVFLQVPITIARKNYRNMKILQAMQELINIMAALRDPDTGCPWDREQTLQSIVPHTLEEVYELVDAIEHGSMEDLRDELGDLLFHVVFYAHLAAEAGAFDFAEVAAGVCAKLRRRHPHVFAGQQVASSAEVQRNWEQLKREENGARQSGMYLDNIARALPAALRAEKLQKRAATVGFDWAESGPVLARLEEEIGELKQAMVEAQGSARLQAELGDVLFATVNLARHLELSSETALRAANTRFEQRFHYIQATLEAAGEDLDSASLERMEELWEAAKQAEAQGKPGLT